MERDFGLRRVARMQAAVGDVESARKTFGELIRIAEGRSPAGRIELLTDVAEAQAQAGLKTDALSTIKVSLALVPKIEAENLRSHALFQVLQAQLLAGDFDGGLKSAESFQGKQSRYRCAIPPVHCATAMRPAAQRREEFWRGPSICRRGSSIPIRAMAQALVAQALCAMATLLALVTARAIGKPVDDDSSPGIFERLFGGQERAPQGGRRDHGRGRQNRDSPGSGRDRRRAGQVRRPRRVQGNVARGI